MNPLFYQHLFSPDLPVNLVLDFIREAPSLHSLKDDILFQLYRHEFNLTKNLIESQVKLKNSLERHLQALNPKESCLLRQRKMIKLEREQEDDDAEPSFPLEKQHEASENYSVKSQKPCTLPRLRKKEIFRYTAYLQDQDDKTKNKCEAKNLVKNFVKFLFSFIKKNQKYRLRILKMYKLEDREFLICLNELNDKVNSIKQLRSLWVEHENCQLFRVISSYYLRKHYAQHIFNSRITNYSIHLKYRVQLQEILKHPQQFTFLKNS